MAEKNIILATGGTGGHIYPAVAFIQSMKLVAPNISISCMGGNLSHNRCLQNHDIEAKEITHAAFFQRSIFNKITAFYKILKGVAQSYSSFSKKKPDLIIGFGSYHSFPVLAAAVIKGIPMILYESNTVPGKVIRLFSRFAKVTTVYFPQNFPSIKGKIKEIQMPLRKEFSTITLSKEKARQELCLSIDKFTILIVGGSQGSAALNALFMESFLEYLSQHPSNIQIIHITGNPIVNSTYEESYKEYNVECLVKDFENKMDLVYAAADIAISRAGSCTLAEQVEMELPSILIPFPQASDNHQLENAKYFVENVKGSLLLQESEATSEVLYQMILKLTSNDRQLINEMKKNIQEYKQKNLKKSSLCSVACEILDLKER